MQAEWVESTVFFDPPVSSRFTPPLSSKQYLRASEAAVAKHAAIIFDQLRQEAAALSGSPLTSGLGERTVLSRSSLSEAAAAVLVEQLRSAGLGEGGAESAALWREVSSALAAPWLLRCVVCDLYKILDVDPAATGLLQPLLYFKGFHALTLHRVAHHLWARDDGPADRFAALRLQSAGERWPGDGREMAERWPRNGQSYGQSCGQSCGSPRGRRLPLFRRHPPGRHHRCHFREPSTATATAAPARSQPR